MDWISETLFGNTTSEHVSLARSLLMWIIIIASILIILRLFWKSELSTLTKSQSRNLHFNFNDISEELNKIDFDLKIREAEHAKNYRLAIRWQYLKILNALNSSNKIVFSPYKTNIEYLREINDTKTRNYFKEISKIYEYVWYGEFEINESNYKKQLETLLQFNS
jgi:hypothetical protein